MKEGLVYILQSPNSRFVKIGGTKQSLDARIREINTTKTYAVEGPWSSVTSLKFSDWQLVEGKLHRHFSEFRSTTVAGTRELFAITASEAREMLEAVDPLLRVGEVSASELFKHTDLRDYLLNLLELSGLFGALDMQGAWTLSLFPRTAGGRFFTFNIGTHEMAFSPRTGNENDAPCHYIAMDELILNYAETINWLQENGGYIEDIKYQTAKEGMVVVSIGGPFSKATQLLSMPGIRRAIIAYWQDWLTEMRTRKTRSLHARFHNYEAVNQLVKYRNARSAELLPIDKVSAHSV